MQKQTYCIYRLFNLINGKSYIGFTKNLKSRIWGHRSSVRRGSTLTIHKAIRKYGWKNFEIQELYYGWNKNYLLNEMEPYFIELYNSKKYGYNMTSGGDGNPELSEKARLRRSNAAKKSWLDPIKRENIVKGQIQNNQNLEKRKIISDKAKERWADPIFKKKMEDFYKNPEILQKKSKAATGRRSPNTIKILEFWKKNPNFQHKEIAQSLNLKRSLVTMVLKRHGKEVGYSPRH